MACGGGENEPAIGNLYLVIEPSGKLTDCTSKIAKSQTVNR